MKQPFDLNISCTTDNFKIYVNDQVMIRSSENTKKLECFNFIC